jgi:hypothetical protein
MLLSYGRTAMKQKANVFERFLQVSELLKSYLVVLLQILGCE